MNSMTSRWLNLYKFLDKYLNLNKAGGAQTCLVDSCPANCKCKVRINNILFKNIDKNLVNKLKINSTLSEVYNKPIHYTYNLFSKL